MCLPIAVDFPERVLHEGVHAGHEFMVVHNDMGYRCGYVKVEPGHPWHGKQEEIDCSVHGGLTFASPDKPCSKGGEDKGWWVGFDCAHHLDHPDPTLPGVDPEVCRIMSSMNGVVRSTEYVIDECRGLCEQAAVAAYDAGKRD